MAQAALFHERIEQALDEVIQACGGRKRFAAEMWPDKSQRDAHNLLDACLNPERREKFAPEQLLYILKRGKAADAHGLMRFINRTCGYEDPRPLNPEDEKTRIQRKFSEAWAQFLATADEAKTAGIFPLRSEK